MRTFILTFRILRNGVLALLPNERIERACVKSDGGHSLTVAAPFQRSADLRHAEPGASASGQWWGFTL